MADISETLQLTPKQSRCRSEEECVFSILAWTVPLNKAFGRKPSVPFCRIIFWILSVKMFAQCAVNYLIESHIKLETCTAETCASVVTTVPCCWKYRRFCSSCSPSSQQLSAETGTALTWSPFGKFKVSLEYKLGLTKHQLLHINMSVMLWKWLGPGLGGGGCWRAAW